VRRNQGRVGAADGPDHLRAALANLPRNSTRGLYDGGTVMCVEGALEAAQAELAERIADILDRGGQPIVIGGGHEVAWGSYQGLRAHLSDHAGDLGIINFDAHFDLRDPSAGASSGTPFKQIAQWCESNAKAFHYLVLGINPAANTAALFDYARAKQVRWFEDTDCVGARLAELEAAVDQFLAPLDALYLTICLDAFPAAVAPGVSAPGVPGICPRTGLVLLSYIREACARLDTRLLLIDVAEMNPRFDRDGITARWAARVISTVKGDRFPT
jgi:formiminoglutamase